MVPYFDPDVTRWILVVLVLIQFVRIAGRALGYEVPE